MESATVSFSLQDRFALFAKKTTFHGFREIRDSNTLWQKVVWSLIILVCLIILSAFVLTQTGRYMDGQRATKVTRLEPHLAASPIVMMVLYQWSWIDLEKVKRLEITPDDIIVSMGYMQRDVSFRLDVPFDQAKAHLQATMHRLNLSGIIQFYSLISRDSFDGVLPESLAGVKVFANSKCYYVINTSNQTQVPFSNAMVFEFTFNFTSFQANIAGHLDFIGFNKSNQKTKLRPFLYNLDTYAKMALRPGYMYVLNTQSSIYRGMTDCTHDHPIDDLYLLEQCHTECKLRANTSLQVTTCIPLTGLEGRIELTDSYRKGNLTLCHLGYKNGTTGKIEGAEKPLFKELTRSQVEERDMEIESCREKCLPRCDQWVTMWSVTSSEIDDDSDTADIRIVYPDPKELVVIEEFRQYDWYDLVSDVGGLLGLWLGASMMSLFQAFHLCCFPEAIRKDKGERRERKEAATTEDTKGNRGYK